MVLFNSESTITGKTHSEIVAMPRWKRYLWYKTISLEEKEKAMQVVRINVSGKKHPCFGRTGSKHPMYGKSRSKEVRAKISAALSGANHPNFGKTPSEETCTKLRKSWTSEKRNAMSEAKTGKNNANWQGGKSFEPYGVEFNDHLKSQIRDRDNHTCQECHQTEEQLERALDVHHTDYDKRNNSPENLISLCHSCHAQTNYGREDWTEYFSKMTEARL